MLPEHKAIRHNQFNNYVFDEVVPYIRNATSPDTFIYVSGASFGALHSMNLFLKRPDIINGCISMSGVYDLSEYTKGFFDDQVYYNSPQVTIALRCIAAVCKFKKRLTVNAHLFNIA